MTGLALDIDHVGLVGPDIHATVAAYRALGFRVTEPVELMGTAPDGSEQSLGQQSAHFIFGSTYVELSEVTEPGPDHHLADWLGPEHAVRILILRANDIHATHQRAAAAGQDPTPVGEASRSLHYASGAVARFRWLSLQAKRFPEALCGYVQHLTPDLVFYPAMNRHPNAAVELTGITLDAADVKDARRRFGLLEDPNAAGRLHIRAAQQSRGRFTALHLRTRSLELTASVLSEAGHRFEQANGRLDVEAPGARLVFSE